ncbi:MAG: autotransporter outer membrane beta-barrel domain-containing protein [Sutterella sp.]|uniref:autotransporter outer membrane beta-barrel domain-containing protein n=2 Tax=Sutterella TaxID=40544 RepID=UPI002848403C|nr:autotransporter outer membrane beta-barrel domain-containing protein [Sutterella sp.]MDR3927569.1 autotransporter outer membrane beta-barrel domain-containing protein [Sutterella sp.]
MKYGKLTPLAFALGMLWAGQSFAADTVVWNTDQDFHASNQDQNQKYVYEGKDLSVELSSSDATNRWNYTLYGRSPEKTDTPFLGTVTTQEGSSYNLKVGGGLSIYIDSFIDKADGKRLLGDRNSQDKSSFNSYTREVGTGALSLENSTIKNASVKQGAVLTSLSFGKVFAGDKNTIESLDNSGTIQSISVQSDYLADNTTSKIEEIKNHGTIGNISSINIGTLSSDAGSIKSITMPNFQIDKIDLKGTALGDATASRADGANGILVTGTGKIGTGQGDAITIDANSSIAGFSIESLTEADGTVKQGVIDGDINIAGKVHEIDQGTGAENLTAGIVNLGTINGALKYSGADELTLINHGTLKKTAANDQANLVLSGTGTVRVKEWYVHIDGENVTQDTAMVVNGVDHLRVDKLVMTSIQNVVTEPGDPKFNLNYAVLDANNNLKELDEFNPNEIARPKEVEFSDELKDYGLGGRYEQNTGWYRAGVDVDRTGSSVLGQTLVNQLARRQVFVDASLADVYASSLYHQREYGQEQMWFVEPYFAQEKSSLMGGATVKGHTTGVMAGGSKKLEDNKFSVFLGYESYEGTSHNLDLDMDTLYFGGNYIRSFAQADTHDFYGKADLLGAYSSTKLARTLPEMQASGTAHTLAYNAAVHVGMNYYLPQQSVLSPEIGLGVMGGRTGAFDVDGSQAQSLEERFDATHVNIGYGDISLKWHQNWEPVLGTSLIKTLMAGGVRYNFNHSMDVGANIAGIWGSDSVDLPRTYQYFNTSLILEFNKNTSITFGYVGVYDSTGHSHNATAKFAYAF